MTSRVRARPLLGTFVEVGIGNPSARSDTAIDEAFTGLERIESLMSFHNPDSELSRLNARAGAEVTLDAHTAAVLRRAVQIGARSRGLFNCTVGGALVRLGVLPGHRAAGTLDSGSHDDIRMRGRVAKLARPVQVTLDGIAKGYAVDHAVAILKQSGVESGWVNAGGDLRVFGNLGLPVRRRNAHGEFAELGEIRNVACATSSVTSEPVPEFPGYVLHGDGGERRPATWSVLAPQAWLADALTKVACLAATDAERQAVVAGLGGQLVPPG